MITLMQFRKHLHSLKRLSIAFQRFFWNIVYHRQLSAENRRTWALIFRGQKLLDGNSSDIGDPAVGYLNASLELDLIPQIIDVCMLRYLFNCAAVSIFARLILGQKLPMFSSANRKFCKYLLPPSENETPFIPRTLRNRSSGLILHSETWMPSMLALI